MNEELKANTNNLIVRSINDTNELHATFGITLKRVVELTRMIDEILNKGLKLGETCVEISKGCAHVNETWWCAMQIGSWYQRKHDPKVHKAEDLLREGRDF